MNPRTGVLFTVLVACTGEPAPPAGIDTDPTFDLPAFDTVLAGGVGQTAGDGIATCDDGSGAALFVAATSRSDPKSAPPSALFRIVPERGAGTVDLPGSDLASALQLWHFHQTLGTSFSPSPVGGECGVAFDDFGTTRWLPSLRSDATPEQALDLQTVNRPTSRCGDLTGDGVEDLCLEGLLIYDGTALSADPTTVVAGYGDVADLETVLVNGHRILGDFSGALLAWTLPLEPGSEPRTIPSGVASAHAGQRLCGGLEGPDGRPAVFVSGHMMDDRRGGGWVLYVDDLADAATLDSAAFRTLRPSEPDDLWFGLSCAVGDVDGDGAIDLLVGSQGSADSPGRVYLFRGPDYRVTTTWEGPRRSSGFGAGLAVGDFDRDGRPDIAVGAPWADDELRGHVYVRFGPVDSWD